MYRDLNFIVLPRNAIGAPQSACNVATFKCLSLSCKQDCWWMMDAIMEFTSAGNMPSVFKDNAGPPVEAATLLPARMDNNQLHRYSKVLSKY